jgi:hypothetical protein
MIILILNLRKTLATNRTLNLSIDLSATRLILITYLESIIILSVDLSTKS